MVFNNEVGFMFVNLCVFCDVGNFMKIGFSIGYIGYKGIGFKFVFWV